MGETLFELETGIDPAPKPTLIGQTGSAVRSLTIDIVKPVSLTYQSFTNTPGMHVLTRQALPAAGWK
jgi:hypothetical protein